MNPQHTIPTLVDDDFVIWDRYEDWTNNFLLKFKSYLTKSS